MSDKDQAREVYKFENDEAFERFYAGMEHAFNNDLDKAIDSFRSSIDLEPDNPFPYNYLVMMLEFKSTSDDERLGLCERWVAAAEKSGRPSQILRSHVSLDFYKLPPEDRIKELKKFGEKISSRMAKDYGGA